MQTYSGGKDVWGLKDKRPEEGRQRGFVNPIFDDGLLEVVGLEGGWKSWAALSGVRKDLHGKRVAQANELKITYHSYKGASSDRLLLEIQNCVTKSPSGFFKGKEGTAGNLSNIL